MVGFFWQQQTMRRGVVSIGVITLISKAIGFLRELLIAYFFGTSGLVDAYRIGETIHSFGTGLVYTSFDVAGVPLLVERGVRHGERSQRALFASFCTLGLLIAGGAALIVFAFAPVLVRVFAPKLSGDTFRLATVMTRVMFPVSFAMILAGAYGAYYNARRQFAVPKIVFPVVNTVAIVFLLLFARQSGLLALAGGRSAGQVVGLAVALLPLLITGHRLIRGLRDPAIKEFLRLSLPLIVVAVMQPLNIAAGRAFASFLPEGNIAILSYADRLFVLPCYFLTATVSTVFFTKAAELAAAGDLARLKMQTTQLLKKLAFVLIPASGFMFILARPIVRFVYERGAFSPESTASTASTLALFGLGLFPFAAVSIITASFRGRKDMKTPAYAAGTGVLITIVLDAVFVRSLGVPGIALATTIGMTVTMIILLAMFSRWKVRPAQQV